MDAALNCYDRMMLWGEMSAFGVYINKYHRLGALNSQHKAWSKVVHSIAKRIIFLLTYFSAGQIWLKMRFSNLVMKDDILQHKFNSDACEVCYLKVKTLMG